MRPKRIEVAGFTAFREPTVVEFDGTELFALVGPTGSGKSSLIDAMTFALYGSVPRYQDARLVAPAVSQGRNQARVRLDFSIGGKDYTAVRVIRRTSTGATTKEARLECDGEVLAGDAKALTEQVERIVGLTFDQFNKCVVLPQGEFAKFLNDKPADRQDLLVKLLGLDLYDHIRERASSRAAEARSRIVMHEEELSSLVGCTKDTERDKKSELKAIESAQKAYQKDYPKLAELEARVDKCMGRVEQCESDIEALAGLKVPKIIQQLSNEKGTRESQLKSAEGVEKAEKAKLAKVDKERAVLGDASPLIEAKQRFADLDDVRKSNATVKKQAEAQKVAVQEAEREVRGSKEALAAAQKANEAAQREHSAHSLRDAIVVGGRCPVCEQAVQRVPVSRAPQDLRKATVAVDRAEATLGRHLETFQQKRDSLSKEERELELGAKRIAALEKQLKAAPDLDVVRERLANIQLLDTQLKSCRKTADAAADAVGRARKELDAFRDREESAWEQFDAVRDDLSHLKPPARKANSLSDSWELLLTWRKEESPKLQKQRDKEHAEVVKIEKARNELLEGHVEAVKQLGYELDEDTALSDELAQFVADAKAELRQISEKLNRKVSLEKLVDVSRGQALLAEALAQHLRADRFERWLLEAAFERLVLSASDVLMGLSSGAYSFAYNKKLEFEVIDHANADETRSARTLSGGETFLASLALALTLADQVADLAAHGAAQLESMFLDEGFGSLDPDTLDTVANAIEELGSRGRMVGLVTHVSDLAERVPVQYRVSKGPTTSTVERIVN
jgi:exonuclease SbcC